DFGPRWSADISPARVARLKGIRVRDINIDDMRLSADHRGPANRKEIPMKTIAGCHSYAIYQKDRNDILSRGDIPFLVSDGKHTYWDKFTWLNPEGSPIGMCVPGLNRQMIRLMQDGYFGELGDVRINQRLWMSIRDCIDTFDCGERVRTGH